MRLDVQTDQRNADEVAFRLLLLSLCDLEPHHGGWRASDLPDLCDADIEVICRLEGPEIDLDVATLIEAKAEGRNPAVLLPAMFQAACKAAIFPAVQEMAERRREQDAQECALDMRCRRAGYRVQA